MDRRAVLANHPCFSKSAHGRRGRIHLPVAPECNVRCGFCVRKFDCVNESRPGVTSRILTPVEALDRVRAVAGRSGNLGAVGIAGPGDPLANEATFETFRLLRREFADLVFCVSTNGLALAARLPELLDAGVHSLTVTINAALPETAEEIYRWAVVDGERLRGRDAAEAVLERQWAGLYAAIRAGLVVKVNTVWVPGVNDDEVPMVAQVAGDAGAVLHNVIPVIPQGRFRDVVPPSPFEVHGMRKRCEGFVSQMTHCRQCRADACGLIGEDRDMDTEALYAALGDDYEQVG